MDGTVTKILAGVALVLLVAILPAFLVAAKHARKTRQQNELETYNAEIEKKREQKKARKNK